MKYLTIPLILLTFSTLTGARKEKSYREKGEFMRHHPYPSTASAVINRY